MSIRERERVLGKSKIFALIEASFNNDLECARHLLDNNDFTTIRPQDIENGLNKALREAVTVDMAELLIEYGADDIGSVLLHNVKFTENLDLIHFYLDVGVSNDFIQMALNRVVNYYNLNLVRLLLDYGADPVNAARYAVVTQALGTLDFILENYLIDDDDFDKLMRLLEERNKNAADRFIERREVEKELSNEDSLLFNLPGPVLEGLMDNLRL